MNGSGSGERGLRIPVWGIATVLIAAIFTASLYLRLQTGAGLDARYCALALFFSVNLLICYWEACLLWRHGVVVRRAPHWAERAAGGASAAAAFLTAQVPLRKTLSTELWADVWAMYSVYDDSYTDRGSFGFNVDIGNGLVTAIPSVLLLATYTSPFLPAVVAGIIGVAVFWQWLYCTSVYVSSFFLAGRHRRIGRKDMYLYFLAPNFPWLLASILGLYTSVRLVLDGNYAVLGF